MSHHLRRPQSPADLIAYARRELGEPVINLELNDEQCLDRVYEAIEKFVYEHFDGVTEGWYPYVVTHDDLTNGYLTMPDDMVSVLGIMDLNNLDPTSGEDFERVNFIVANSDMMRQVVFNHGDAGLLSWHLTMAHLEMLNDYFSPEMSFQYNETTKRLYLNKKLPAPTELAEDHVSFPILIHGFRAIDPDVDVKVYGNEWVRRYTTALIGRQWGNNIKKYDGVQLPGGVVLNGDKIFDQYNQLVDKLDEQFDLRYKLPGEMYIG